LTPSKEGIAVLLDQVDHCDYFVLIIGARRGGTYIGSERSITNEEYARAVKRGKPIITFIKRDVQTAFQMFKKNPKANLSDLVDDVRLFDFVEMLSSRAEDNWLRPFETVEDIKKASTAQFAYLSLLYAQTLAAEHEPKKAGSDDNTTVVRFPTHLPKAIKGSDTAEAASIVRGLRSLHKIISEIKKSPAAGKGEKLKLLWVFGRYAAHEHEEWFLNNDRLKQYTWGVSRGRRVFTQIRDFGVRAWYDDEPNDDGSYFAHLGFAQDADGEISWALSNYVGDLLKLGDQDWAYERFMKADMTVYE
jgi:hypothetical protein